MRFSNAQVAKILRDVAAAYTIKEGSLDTGQNTLFQVRAYEAAASAIESSTSEITDLWKEGNLEELPGIGASLQDHLNELFTTGRVKHWEELEEGIPEEVFTFLEIPGVGPSTAQNLSRLGAQDLKDLKKKLISGLLVEKGLSQKMADKLLRGLESMGQAQSGRMLLPYAFTQAERVLEYLKNSPVIEEADVLGSLRRMVATVGDLDFAVASKDSVKTAAYITRMSGAEIVEKGEAKVTLRLPIGIQLDFLITEPDSYGALLQHFTGSKAHNIHLRTLAERKGLSLSEYGVKNTKTGKVQSVPTEEKFYGLLGMDVPPPEIREDTGEVEAALSHKLPQLVELKDIKGDLHLHSDALLQTSHDPGRSSIAEIVGEAKELGYDYIGISDHQPSVVSHAPEQIVEILRKRSKLIEQINTSSKIRVLNLLEVDIMPDGSLSVPDDGLKLLDFALAGVHSSHGQSKDAMTVRILKALENPRVKVLTHPTGRLLNERASYEADWPKIFDFAAKNNKAMEISAWPNRLDLPDGLVRQAKEKGVKFVINTDSHEKSQMELMKFGVAVARRGWVTKEDVVNAWDWTKFAKWFNLS